ncbi:MAG: hypothetical protein QG603_471, partial [Patescibacteria group bacterium]|nr:hypothetical protein [Patescibacteria group bacterium]
KGTEVIASGLLQFDEKVVRLDVFDKSDLQTEQKVLGEKIATSSSTSTVGTSNNFSQSKKIIKYILFAVLLSLITFFLYKKIKNK